MYLTPNLIPERKLYVIEDIKHLRRKGMMFIQVYVITEKEFGEHEDHDLQMRDKGHH